MRLVREKERGVCCARASPPRRTAAAATSTTAVNCCRTLMTASPACGRAALCLMFDERRYGECQEEAPGLYEGCARVARENNVTVHYSHMYQDPRAWGTAGTCVHNTYIGQRLFASANAVWADISI
jgi:hypothetical protein